MKRKIASVVFFVVFALIVIGTSSCYHDKADVLYPATTLCDTSTAATYAASVVPILNSACNRCHGGSASQGNGIKLDTYNSVKNYVNNGLLLQSINHDPSVEPMPKNAAKLDNCTITTIQRWVNAGALNN
jgi:hypothetical protein